MFTLDFKQCNKVERLYTEKDRNKEDLDFIEEVCNWIISSPLENKEYSNDFSAVYVEGRSRDFCLEDLASLWSFKRFSKKNYPIFLFLYDPERFLKGFDELIDCKYDFRLVVYKIPELKSLEEYSNFCTKKLYFMLPEDVRHILTLQPDGMLLREGWEDYVLNLNCDWISSHWKHYGSIDSYTKPNNWLGLPPGWRHILGPTAIGNGGFSYRNAQSIKDVLNLINSYHLILREHGREDNRAPMEDLLICSLLRAFSNYKLPTLKQCDYFSIDPLTKEIWDNKEKWSFGFHYFKTVSEFPPCNHD